MRVVLQRPVENLGQPGDVVEVADGYARNFLVPRGLAVKAHKGMVRHSESLKRAHEARLSKQREEFDALAQRLAAEGPLRIWARAGDEGRLFGSVTAADVAEAIQAQHGVAVDRRDVHFDEAIKSVGTHEVRVHLFHDVDPVVTVEVLASG